MSGKNEKVYPELPAPVSTQDAYSGQDVQQPHYIQAQRVMLGPNPTMVKCPYCNHTQMSRVRYEISSKTHLFAIILLLISLCCCIPYFIDSCKNANHICSNCGAYLGSYDDC